MLFFPIQAQENPESAKVASQHLYDKLLKTQKEYDEAMASGDSLEVAEMCYRLGKRYISIGKHAISQQWFIRSLRIREPLGFSEDVGKVYIFMANYPSEQQELPKAIYYVHKAMMNFNAVGNQHGIMSASLMLAGFYGREYDLHQNTPEKHPQLYLDSALYYIQRAEKLAVALKFSRDIGLVYEGYGYILLKLDMKRGLDYLMRANSIFIKEKYSFKVIHNSLILGDTYLSLHQLGEAKKWLDRASYVIDTSGYGDIYQQRHIMLSYSKLYEQIGNWKAALEYYKKYQQILMQTLNADREGAVTRIEIEYETQKKEVQLKAQQKELALRTQNLQNQQRIIQMSIGLGVIAVIISIIFYWFFQKYKRISQQNAALVSEQNHRVKNNLQQVTNLLSLQSSRLKDEEAKKAVTESLLRIEAMALVHHRLYDGHRLIEVNLALFIPELIDGILRSYSYSHLQPVYRLDPVWLHVDSAIPMGLLINELVTNSCKYAFPFSPDPVIRVECQLKKNQIHFELTDNGPGFDLSQKSKTFGLKLLQIFSTQLKAESAFENGGRSFRLVFIK